MARGRAETPMEIPAPGWRTSYCGSRMRSPPIMCRLSPLVSPYALLAIFPAVTALMALAGLVMEPAQVTAQLGSS